MRAILRLSQKLSQYNFQDREEQMKRNFQNFKSKREEERRDQVVDGKRVSD